MITKIIWGLIALNTTALVFYIITFLASFEGRNVDSMETGWMTILFVLGAVVILLAAIPLRMSQSTFAIWFSGFFAALPLVVGSWMLLSDYLPSFKKQKTAAEFYYKDPAQRAIATAIEKSDTAAFEEAIKGQDLTIKGTSVYEGEDGFNYLEFAIDRRRDDPAYDEKANTAMIRTLIAKGTPTTRAMAQGILKLPMDVIASMIDAGADPNTYGPVDANPLLFAAVTREKENIDMAIMLVKRGADVNKKHEDGSTVLQYAAVNGGAGRWPEAWRFVRFLLEETKVDYKYTRPGYLNFAQIVETTRKEATEKGIVMTEDFLEVEKWMKSH